MQDDVAIIGMALRFPGADSPEEFWENLVEGRESLVELTDAQLAASGVPEHQRTDPDYVRLRPLIADPEMFDAVHFGLTPREAEIMNPQHRLFLEACDTALQRAGVDAGRSRRVGVFGGGSPNRYVDNVYLASMSDFVGDMAVEISNQPDYLATRVSHILGLSGPSVTVQTACSTALVAVHHARQALLADECDLALAGGVSIELPYRTGTLWSPQGIHSQDGHVRTFDRAATGTNFGSGVGVVVLKRLDRALADGDHVHAVVAGTLTNNDGADRPGFTSPGTSGQVDLLRRVLENAAIDPRDIGYVEAHGTGTTVGDPIEFRAICAALATLGYGGGDVPKIPIGSVKTNIGHLGPAAGIAGLIKTALSIEHGEVVPSLHFTDPNPEIDLEGSPLTVATSVAPWARPGERIATVSSFGIGGTNAVAVLRSAPERIGAQQAQRRGPASRPRIVPISAVDDARLKLAVAAVAQKMADLDDERFPGVVRNLQSRRQGAVRTAVVAHGPAELAARLEHVRPAPTPPADRRVGWLFPGQGAQFPGMAAAVSGDPHVAQALDECVEAFADHGVPGLAPLLIDPPGSASGDLDGRLTSTEVAQAALFATGYALGTGFRHYVGEPEVLVGHSIGEYAAACLAGVMSLDEAVRVVAQRGRLMRQMAPGAMVAVMSNLELVRGLVPDTLDVAAVNGPTSFVVSGPLRDVEQLCRKLELLAVGHSVLRTSHAFHSRMMRPAAEELLGVLQGVDLRAPQSTIVSTVTGEVLTAHEATDPMYWSDQILRPVRFGDAIARAGQSVGIVVELGPGTTLSTLTTAVLGPEVATVTPCPRPRQDAARTGTAAKAARAEGLLPALADLWSRGGDVNWAAVDPQVPPLEAFPAAPYLKSPFWIDEPADDDEPAEADPWAALPVDRSTWLPTWRRTSVGIARIGADGANEPLPTAPASDTRRWLVVHDGGLGAVVDVLRTRGDRVISVLPSADSLPDASGPDDHVVDRAAAEPWQRLFRWLEADDAVPSTVVYGQHRDPEEPSEGFFDLLHLLQATGECWVDRDVVVRAVTVRSQSVTGAEPVDPTGALLHGPVSVLSQELPHLRGGCIDVTVHPRDGSRVRSLVNELDRREPEPWVALRGRGRWSRVFEPFPLEQQPVEDEPVVRPGGVYVITGGAGAIGIHILRHLTRTPGCRVAVLSRRGPRALGFNDRDLQAPVADASVPTLVMEALAADGAEVMALAADVADRASLAAALATVRERWGAITAVYHAAGTAGGELAILRTDERCREVLAPKVDGTTALLEEVHGEAELVHLFSSIIAVSSDVGMVDYCAANSFMDAAALAWSDERTRVVSVNWCGWSDTGMVVRERSVASDLVRDAAMGVSSRPARHPLLDRRLLDDELPSFVSVVEPGSGDFLDDHRMGGERVLSGTTLVEMIRAAAAEAVGGPVEVGDVVLGAPVVVDRVLEVVVAAGGFEGGVTSWNVIVRPHGSRETGPAQVCAVARTAPQPASRPSPMDVRAVGERCDATNWLPDLDAPNSVVEFGERWRALRSVAIGGSGEQLLRLELAADVPTSGFTLHPVLLDNATSLGLYLPDILLPGQSFLPAGYERIRTWQPLSRDVVCNLMRRPRTDEGSVSFDVLLADPDGEVAAHVEGFRISLLADAQSDAIGTEGASAGLPGEPVVPSPRGAAADVPVAGYVDSGQYLLSPDEGLTLLDALLRQRSADHVVLCRRDPHHVGREPVDDVDLGDAPADDLVDDLEDGLTPTEAMVTRMWRATLGQRSIPPDADFFDLGGNSLVVVQLLAKMRAHVGMSLPGRVLVENPTVRGLAAAIDAIVESVQPPIPEPVGVAVPASS